MSNLWKSLTGNKGKKKDGSGICTNKQGGGKKTKRTKSSSSSSRSRTTTKSDNSTVASATEKTTSYDSTIEGTTVIANFRTPNEQVVDAYLEDVNRRAPVEELLKHFTSQDVPILMEDSPPANAMFLLTEVRKVYLSFPNVQFNNESIKEVRPGEVLLEEMEVTGTHTGEAYQFAHFPPIPTTNKHVVLDRERLWFTIKDGKIDKMVVIALGNLTGPPGMYMSIGGKMEMPPSA